MSGEAKRTRGLGRGLAALLGDLPAEGFDGQPPRTVAIDCLVAGRFQPRRRIDEGELKELARSIAAKGVLQPILVRRDAVAADRYEIIAGERRWRAAQLAGLHEVPVVVKDLADREAMEIALIENLQRQDLSPLDEAEGYRRLIAEFGHTQEALAESIGKSRSHVANTLRLLALPEGVKALVDDGRLTAGHARALLTASDPVALAQTVIRRGLNVRQTERLAARSSAARRSGASATASADTAALERDLSARLGLAVEIRHRGSGGRLVLHYATLEQLDDLLKRLTVRPIAPGEAGDRAAAAERWER